MVVGDDEAKVTLRVSGDANTLARQIGKLALVGQNIVILDGHAKLITGKTGFSVLRLMAENLLVPFKSSSVWEPTVDISRGFTSCEPSQSVNGSSSAPPMRRPPTKEIEDLKHLIVQLKALGLPYSDAEAKLKLAAAKQRQGRDSGKHFLPGKMPGTMPGMVPAMVPGIMPYDGKGGMMMPNNGKGGTMMAVMPINCVTPQDVQPQQDGQGGNTMAMMPMHCATPQDGKGGTMMSMMPMYGLTSQDGQGGAMIFQMVPYSMKGGIKGGMKGGIKGGPYASEQQGSEQN